MENRRKPAPLFVPEKQSTFKLTDSGTFTEGDLTINRNGIRLNDSKDSSKLSPISTPLPLSGSRPSSPTSQGSCSPKENGDLRISNSSGETESGPSTSQVEGFSGDCPVMNLKDLKQLSQLGRGSSGVVSKVQHVPTGEIYALKCIQMDMQEQVRKNILQELRTLHDAKCDHIVQCHGSFYSNGVIYSVLEYMDAGSLAQILKSVKSISEKHLSKIAKQVLEGLIYLHKELHVIHRDIKPCNLLINLAGEVKISDFGVSGKLASSVADCASFVGTVTYMSPERISGSCYSYDCDIWSLGLSVLELAQGRFPYPPTETANGGHPLSFWDLLDYIVEQPPPKLASEKFSADFCDFVAVCLQKEPKKRATATDLMAHPFITKFNDTPNDILASLVSKVTEPPV
eukprot:CAMPEP_0196593990 /NCGR_PEP_ID=MMETSP1081-20130531/77086_1 /TAXON_ID=36882 /ORGANISM="Pyramimonas amylifera, Strain CCMP720" /LENGTH=399 /DNA_ID=CAMNT_0041918129 /DNA_START=75 /DNA_END=1274 /DNA_ORIENTATION=+